MSRQTFGFLLSCLLAGCTEDSERLADLDDANDDEEATALAQQRIPTFPGFPGFPGIRRDGGLVRPRLPRPPPRPDAGRATAGTTGDGGAPPPTSPADGGPPSAGADTDPACSGLTYETFGRHFLETYCLACHQGDFAARHINLSTQSGVQTWKGAIGLHAVETRTSIPMPPDEPGLPRPSDEEREQLGRWLRCGAE